MKLRLPMSDSEIGWTLVALAILGGCLGVLIAGMRGAS